MLPVEGDIGTCIDFCGTQLNGLSHFTELALSEYEVRGCGLMKFQLYVTLFIGRIVRGKLDTYLIYPNVVRKC